MLRSRIGGERGPCHIVTSVARIRRPVAFLASSDRLMLQKVDTPPRYEIIVKVEAAKEDARKSGSCSCAALSGRARDGPSRGKDFDPAHVRIFAVHVIGEDGDLEQVSLQRLSVRSAVSVARQEGVEQGSERKGRTLR